LSIFACWCFPILMNTFVSGARKVISGCARQFLRMDISGQSDQVRAVIWLVCFAYSCTLSQLFLSHLLSLGCFWPEKQIVSPWQGIIIKFCSNSSASWQVCFLTYLPWLNSTCSFRTVKHAEACCCSRTAVENIKLNLETFHLWEILHLRCHATNEVCKLVLILCLQRYGITKWFLEIEITDMSLTNASE